MSRDWRARARGLIIMLCQIRGFRFARSRRKPADNQFLPLLHRLPPYVISYEPFLIKIVDRVSLYIWVSVPTLRLNRIARSTIVNLIWRSEEYTSELQSHSFISYAVFC